MRSLLITAVVLTTAITLGGCRNKRPEPLPGPQSAFARSSASYASVPAGAMSATRARVMANTDPALSAC